jgi:dipeptidyl aminopeptidase/acylaminoacyl peptidase
VSLKTRERKRLLEGGTSPRYLPTGHLVFGRVASLLAVPFDADRLEVKGSPVPLLEGVETLNSDAGAAKFTVSGGVLAYLPPASAQAALAWMTRSGVPQPTGAPERAYLGDVALSPRGDRAAVTIREAGRGEIWVYDLARRTLGRVTFDGDNAAPVWAPDGKRVAFSTTRPGESVQTIQVKSLESGASPDRVMTATQFGGLAPLSWSPDGRALVIFDKSPTTAEDIWVLPLEGERKPTPLVQTPFSDFQGCFSPDGRFLAFDSTESGRTEVYVQAYPGPGGKWQVSTEGGQDPLWAPGGRELFYRSGDELMAVDVQTAPEFKTSAPHVLFESRFSGYAVAPDGRFLVVRPAAQDTGPAQLQVVVGWFDELREKLGAAPK